MKRLIACASLVLMSGIGQVECYSPGKEASTGKGSNNIEFYCGVGINESLMSSKFYMSRDVDGINIQNTSDLERGPRGYVYNCVTCHDKRNINKLGYEVFFGAVVGSDWFIAPEVGLNFQHVKHRYAFLDFEDVEFSYGDIHGNVSTGMDVRYGNSYQFLLKFGKTVNNFRFYGIAGLENRLVDVCYYTDSPYLNPPFSVNFRERINALVLGVGGSRKINDHVSLALEYKYKPYEKVHHIRDLIAESSLAYTGEVLDESADLSPRDFKVSQRQHDLSLRVIVNI